MDEWNVDDGAGGGGSLVRGRGTTLTEGVGVDGLHADELSIGWQVGLRKSWNIKKINIEKI